jgi:hypothetical protein
MKFITIADGKVEGGDVDEPVLLGHPCGCLSSSTCNQHLPFSSRNDRFSTVHTGPPLCHRRRASPPMSSLEENLAPP